MSCPVHFPIEEFAGQGVYDIDLAADYLELSAFFSAERQCFSQDIVDASEIAEDGEEVDDDVRRYERVAFEAIARMGTRRDILGESYPFEIDGETEVVRFVDGRLTTGQGAYLVCLLLSNLREISPLLGADVHPDDAQIRNLRQYFQYFATAAMAAEVSGPSWSFGFPRPDGTGFLEKLAEVWRVMNDGLVYRDPSAPQQPKDDKIDIFARREPQDGLPGFLLVAAQVATGKNWKEKPIKSHLSDVFPRVWFRPAPATKFVPYHVIPFARPDREFRHDVLVLGNVLHRLRVPSRVDEARTLAKRGIPIEAFDRLDEAIEWIGSYPGQVMGFGSGARSP